MGTLYADLEALLAHHGHRLIAAHIEIKEIGRSWDRPYSYIAAREMNLHLTLAPLPPPRPTVPYYRQRARMRRYRKVLD